MPTSLGDWIWGTPQTLADVRSDVQAKYGTNVDQPPLRSVNDPTPYKAFHDDHDAQPMAFTSGPRAYSGGG